MSYVIYKDKKYDIKENTLKLTQKNIKHLLEIDGLASLTDLEKLVLSGNNITELRGLEELTNLKTLYLNSNQISKIEGLENLENLTTLDISANKISEINGLENLRNLENLHLNSNQIFEIKGLERLTNLKSLFLNSNKISSINNLKNLKSLIDLFLDNNKITEIENLEELENLKNLSLRKNEITEIKGLESLNNLEYFLADNNPIKDPEELFMIKCTFNAFEIVDYCKNRSIGQRIVPFVKFEKKKTLDENIKKFKEDLKAIQETARFVEIGTFKELQEIKAKQHVVFLEQPPTEDKLFEKIITSKKIIIHMIQLHSLKGISKRKVTKVRHFKFFIKHFWSNSPIKNSGVLIYKDDKLNRVNYKIDEILDLSINNYSKRFNENKPDLIIFPENSIPNDKVKDLKRISKENNLIIIGGLEHKEETPFYMNKAIIIDNGLESEQIKQTPVWIYDREKKRKLKEDIECVKLPDINILNFWKKETELPPSGLLWLKIIGKFFGLLRVSSKDRKVFREQAQNWTNEPNDMALWTNNWLEGKFGVKHNIQSRISDGHSDHFIDDIALEDKLLRTNEKLNDKKIIEEKYEKEKRQIIREGILSGFQILIIADIRDEIKENKTLAKKVPECFKVFYEGGYWTAAFLFQAFTDPPSNLKK